MHAVYPELPKPVGLGESDGICGMRVMSYPTCGNTEPSGAFLIEYLGTVTARTQIHAGTAMYNTTRLETLWPVEKLANIGLRHPTAGCK